MEKIRVTTVNESTQGNYSLICNDELVVLTKEDFDKLLDEIRELEKRVNWLEAEDQPLR